MRSPAESRALVVDFSGNGPSAISSAIRILPGDGVLKIVNFIQVVAGAQAHLCGDRPGYSHRLLASVGRDKMQVLRLRPAHNGNDCAKDRALGTLAFATKTLRRSNL